MANKKNMPCNKPRPSDRAGKKRMVKACEGGREKLMEQKDMDIIIQQLQERASRHVTSAEQQNPS